ncbi:MAG: DUF1844 domain-containing protein [Pseudomonadota bacterium]
MSEEEKKNPDFSIKDRRRFDSEGNQRGDDGSSSVAKDAEERWDSAGKGGVPKEFPEIDFSNFVLSLAAAAMMYLGETALPDGTMKKDVAVAKQNIDILAMIEEKTKGNLKKDEEKLLREMLYELRMRFVSASK